MTTSSTEPTASEQATDPVLVSPVTPETNATNEATAATTEAPEAPEAPEASETPDAEQTVTETKQQVELVRSVRFGRILVVFSVLGGVLAALACVFFPVNPEQHYTLGQIMGFSAIIGAAIGLCIGALVSLVLGAAAKRRRGTAVAIQSDVQ
ncbi:hypothetical protein [Leucobacter sp. 1207-22]|uniref:hypothetical protein n=1 Tax=Leucobacter sp. 1207-22 TaxID=2604456 RepID=UPI0040628F96